MKFYSDKFWDNFPIMLRKTHVRLYDRLLVALCRERERTTLLSDTVNSRTATIDAQNELLDILRGQIVDHKLHIESLMKALTDIKSLPPSPPAPVPAKKPITAGMKRGGWRKRSQQASMDTFPKPGDSIEALEQRVKQGGKT